MTERTIEAKVAKIDQKCVCGAELKSGTPFLSIGINEHPERRYWRLTYTKQCSRCVSNQSDKEVLCQKINSMIAQLEQISSTLI